jgi:signal transduction histidine kinase
MWGGAGRAANRSLTRQSLTRQSLLVAGACLAADVLVFCLGGNTTDPARWIPVLAGIVVADAALATAASWSGAVAILNVAVGILGSVLLGTPTTHDFNEAGMLIAAYRAGAWLRGTQAVGALAVLAGGTVATHLICGAGLGWLTAVEALKNSLLPWMVGRYTTARRAYLDELKQQAERERRDAREALHRAVAEDRSAIARDLHDVIAHHVSAINVHAGAARLSLGTGADAHHARDSVSAVEVASRAAMTDLRHLLDVLHGDRVDGIRQPGVDNLDELLDGVRAAGVRARLAVRGTPRRLPDSLSVALFRIVQEMLTNALRHGDGGDVAVTLTYAAKSLELSTVNGIGPVTVPADPGPHRGLVGIRNRVGLFEGDSSSGPEPDGRTWRTTVTFPLDEEG